MNQTLKNVFDKTVSLFEKDSRVVAAYHSGSVGTDKEDEFSDVDSVFLTSCRRSPLLIRNEMENQEGITKYELRSTKYEFVIRNS